MVALHPIPPGSRQWCAHSFRKAGALRTFHKTVWVSFGEAPLHCHDFPLTWPILASVSHVPGSCNRGNFCTYAHGPHEMQKWCSWATKAVQKGKEREREREGEIRLTMCTHTDLAYVHHSVLLFYENGHFDPVGSATYIDLHRFGSIWIIYHES